jgi:ATP-dependent Clp protease ATP-binding subunit ClpB
MAAVRAQFRPEFINRIDEFLFFDPLSLEQIKKVVALQVDRVAKRLKDKKMTLQMHESAMEYIAARGFDPVYGARPVKRAVQRELETPLAKALLRGQFVEEDTIVVEAVGGADATALSLHRPGEAPAENVVSATLAYGGSGTVDGGRTPSAP